MGRLLNEQEIVEKNTKRYMENSTGEYSRFLDGATPSFVTYYRKNVLKSTTDLGLENAEKILGTNSPIKYDKIENFAIFGIDTIQLNLNREDFGAQTSYESEGIVLPNTIKPLPDDYFSINILGDEFLFKITNVYNDKIQGKFFYKVEFSLSKILDDKDDIIENLDETFSFILTNVGTDHKAVIPKKDKLSLDYLNQVYNKLYDFYMNHYFNSRFNIFTMNFYNNDTGKEIKIYNQSMYNFIINNKIMKKDRHFMDSVYVNDVLKKDTTFYSMYRHTIYHAMETQDHSNLISDHVNMLDIALGYTQFRHYPKQFYNMVFMPDNTSHNEILQIFDIDFFNKIRNNSLYDEQDLNFEEKDYKFFYNTIIRYINNELEMNTEFIDEVNNYDFFPDLKNYVFIPLIMFILKNFKNRLLEELKL